MDAPGDWGGHVPCRGPGYLDEEKKLVTLSWPVSKTDPEARGVKRTLQCLCGGTCSSECPYKVSADLVKKVTEFNGQHSLLAVTKSGQGVEKSQVVASWAHLFGMKVGGHSARRTGALEYIRSGWEVPQVAYLGRWKSSVILSYAQEALETVPANAKCQAKTGNLYPQEFLDREEVAQMLQDTKDKVKRDISKLKADMKTADDKVKELSDTFEKCNAESNGSLPAFVMSLHSQVVHDNVDTLLTSPPFTWRTKCGWYYSSSHYSFKAEGPITCAKCKGARLQWGGSWAPLEVLFGWFDWANLVPYLDLQPLREKSAVCGLGGGLRWTCLVSLRKHDFDWVTSCLKFGWLVVTPTCWAILAQEAGGSCHLVFCFHTHPPKEVVVGLLWKSCLVGLIEPTWYHTWTSNHFVKKALSVGWVVDFVELVHSVHYNLFGVAVFAYKFHSMEILALHLWKKSWPGLRRLKLVSWNCCMPLWRDVMQNTALFAKMVFMRLRQRTFSKLRFVCLVKWLTKIIQVWSCARNPIFAPVVTFLGRAKAWWKTVGRFVLQKIYPWVCWPPFWIWHGMWRSLRTPQWKDP